MLFGEYSHQVDAKNRIRIPAKLKSEFTGEYVFLRGASKCISVYPISKIDELIGQVANVGAFDIQGQESLSEVLSGFYQCEEDGQGRIVIPEQLRAYAGIEKEVVSIGMINHIDIYSDKERERIKNEKSYSERIALLQGRLK